MTTDEALDALRRAAMYINGAASDVRYGRNDDAAEKVADACRLATVAVTNL